MAGRKLKDRTGERRLANCGLWMKIIAYRSNSDIDVLFDNGTTSHHKKAEPEATTLMCVEEGDILPR